MLPYLILQRIIMLEYQRLPLVSDGSRQSINELCSHINIKVPKQGIHPIDSFLALFHCCDNFLQQDILSRLSICQLAIPFLLPDPISGNVTFLLWAMRSIIREWKPTTGVTTESRIVDHGGPMISFLRMGKAQDFKSKSRMLNMVIGEHDYFYHWNCEGGSFERQFVDGLVELCCYFPSGKHDDYFSDATYFLNLRGEATNHCAQVDFIHQVSFMSFILLLENNINKKIQKIIKRYANLPGGVVVIFPDYKEAAKHKTFYHLAQESHKTDNKISMLDIKGKNDADTKNTIRQIISEKLSKSKPKKFITIAESAAVATKIGIKVDEEEEECAHAKTLAEDTMEKLKILNPTQAKAKALPLQGSELWHTWANLDKESFQMTYNNQMTVGNNIERTEQRKKTIRETQLHCFSKGLTPVMKNFIDGLNHESVTVKNYFLHWMKIFLDNRSRKILPGMHAHYETAKQELKKLHKRGVSEKSQEYITQINSLKKQNIDLVQGSLGLEHFFRELGQLFEAGQLSTKSRQLVKQYPQIAVEILNSGYPIELMDGDTSYVPITWVSEVLFYLKKCHEGKTVFIISIIGIQSTGKSTLLNTMFGLQFNVSAGRCTRGAFIQLLPVNKQANKLMCDYVLIVDTEGLRAPELGSEQSYKHDNPLATFIIGIADVTIVNILGETPGDLNDILQTAVHAFIRMKNVDMKLNCHFVHQNVAAVDNSKLTLGKESFLDNLNKMTLAAAKTENVSGRYHSFQDVIQFEEKKDISYFPSLWKGDPPMAPINPGYTHKAKLLKHALMKLSETQKGDPVFSVFQLRVEQLWCAVCRENYIFSFKNTLEVMAYNELDGNFSKWSWALHRKMVEWQLETENTISNICSEEKLNQAETECFREAESLLDATFADLKIQMNDFFETSEHCKTLAQWRGRYEIELKHLQKDSIKEAEQQCALLKLTKQNQLKLEGIIHNHRQQLLKHITTLVRKSKDSNESLTEKALENKFNERWEKWIKEISDGIDQRNMYRTDEEIECDISNTLQQLCRRDGYVLIARLCQNLIEWGKQELFPLQLNPQKHLSCKLETHKPTSAKFKGDFQHANRKHDHFVIIMKQKFSKKQKNFQNYEPSVVFDLLSSFKGIIEDYNQQHQNLFTKEYITDMTMSFAGYMTVQITQIMQEIRIKNDPVASLNKLKSTYYNTFIDQYKEIKGEKAATSSLCSILSVAIESAVVEALPDDIVDKMKSSAATYKTKSYFKVQILKDLAIKNTFKLYSTYLRDIRSCFEWWAALYVEDFCMENYKTNLLETARPIIHRILNQVIEAAKKIQTGVVIQLWLTQFHGKLSKIIKLNLNEILDIIEANPNHSKTISQFFVKELTEGLKKEEQILLKKITDPKSKFATITKWNKSPHIILCDSLIGCIEQCPFCGEQCELTDCNHSKAGKDHYIDIHRPECLGRYTWIESNELVFESCSELVESTASFKNKDTNENLVAYKMYRTIYDKWTISNDKPSITPIYWHWFIQNHIDEIISWAGAAQSSKDRCPKWSHVTKDEAVESLSKIYSIT